jgi:hypothetical protein
MDEINNTMSVHDILKKLLILQTVSNEKRHQQGLKRLGKGYFEAHRFNPYNPLSYIAYLIILIVGILMFGFVGIHKEADTLNPFKWN